MPDTHQNFRPTMHFSAPFGWINDPNGLVYMDGEWHLFYQYYPFGTTWGPMHWGHAVSRDLLQWEHLPIALKPDQNGQCFSGSSVVDTHNTSGLFEHPSQSNLVSLYTNTLGLTAIQDNGLQAQSIATSTDGRYFKQHIELNPVAPNEGIQHFRDPKVFWHDPTNKWIMVVTEGQSIGLYGSTTLTKWEKLSTWGEEEAIHDELPWECPDLFPITDDQGVERWVLVIGLQRAAYAGGSGTQYVVGHFDGERFTNLNAKEDALYLDYGKDFYAAQSFSNAPNGRRIAIAWMSNWLYANDVPTDGYRGSMTLPRELFLITTEQGLRLKQSFIIDSLTSSANEAIQHNEPNQWCFELKQGLLKAELKMSKDTQIEIKPFGGKALTYRISHSESGYLVETKRKVVVSSSDVFEQAFPYQSRFIIPSQNALNLMLAKDAHSCELLLCDGLYSCTDTVFTHDTGKVTCSILEGQILMESVDVLSHT
ncbi:glycoside hydrolase family 32 protein [Marinomonas mediterranea]|uniref:glycoside hydrolase family 32 protein n=1 Tax=Marinomonas mediterranea TaxID=119864 RepID=UPI0023495C26|nr:glycoside hydrolase family 32 protein [Marinomonas mediterranea]WCN14963.1 glycoside hydrolase family 32 protein [Marinomonas mediterranea]